MKAVLQVVCYLFINYLDIGVKKSSYISDIQKFLVLDVSIRVGEQDHELRNQHYWATDESF